MRLRVFITCTIISLVAGTFASSLLAQTVMRAPGFRGQPNAGNRDAVYSGHRAPVESENFIVHAATTQLANKVSREAERYRKELAQQWLGKELPRWRDKCPITVKVEMHAGGETSFAFMPDQTGKSHPIDWRMKIFGPPDRLLDAVLPHEITHTIFATHFGRPLPRWADEGACTTVEHISERQKNHQMLMQFLSAQPSRGIPFNRMFTMKNYPSDILPLYAQGYSLARFLIQRKGRRHFLDYVSRGLENENRGQILRAWDSATKEFYGFKDLSGLQLEWLAWVKLGSPDDQQAKRGLATAVASFDQTQELDRTLTGDESVAPKFASVKQAGFTEVESLMTPETVTPATFAASSKDSQSWYKRQMNAASRVAQGQDSTKTRKVSPDSNHIRDSRLPSSPKTIWR